MNKLLFYTSVWIWLIVVIYLLFKTVINSFRKRSVKDVYHKRFDANNKDKPIRKYLCEVILSKPTPGFDEETAIVTVELIYTNTKSDKTRVASLAFDMKEALVTRDICFQRHFRGYFMIVRHRSLPVITCVRAVHNCSKDSSISVEGLEIHDQFTGSRTLYLIRNPIINIRMKEAAINPIRPQRLEFCSKHTFCPDFHSLEIEDFGQIRSANEGQGTKPGIRLMPRINWFEEFTFNAFLIHLTFAFMTAILFYLKDETDLNKCLLAVVGSGLISPTVTQIICFSYRFVVKTNYKSKCSPIKIELGKSSIFWRVFRLFYLMSTLLMCSMLSILATFLIEDDMKLKFKFITESIGRDVQILITLFFITLVFEYTVWLLLFAFLRFLIRFICFNPRPEVIDVETPKDDDNSKKDNQKRTVTPKDLEKKTFSEKTEKSERSEISTKPKSKLDTKLRSKLNSNTAEEEKNYSEQVKNNELNTGSVIVRPTQSLGYIDPKMFRLSASQLDLTKDDDKKN